ncbi:hypothetical protein SRHO_G00207100 [Serrasalmus rhombeus]
MPFCWLYLCIYSLWFKVSVAKGDSWHLEVPPSVVGLEGSCVVIPCLLSYPGPDRKASDLTGIWFTDSNEIVYHSSTTKISTNFQHRTSLLGELRHRNCSLKISPLQHTDSGPFTFRIEIEDFNKYSFTKNKVSITVKDTPEPPTLSVEQRIKSGKKVTTTCTFLHSCPSDPPNLTWSHQGKVSSQSTRQTNGQWKVTSSLSFTPSKRDHEKLLSCTAVFTGGKKVSSITVLNVTYPPVSVEVISSSSVQEGDSVELNCSSDGNPAAHAYRWFTERGTLVSEGQTYMLKSVKRHPEPIYCTAINTEGQASSTPIQLNVLYPPEIKVGSSCTSEISTATCLCMVDSHPTSDIKWWTSDPSKVLNSSNTEIHGSLTIVTLQGVLDSNTVHCHASNSQGNSTMTLRVPHNGKLVYTAVAVSVFLVVITGLTVWMVKRSHVSSKTEEPVTHRKTEENVTSQPGSERDCKAYSTYGGSQNVYGNMTLEEEQCSDTYEVTDGDAVYANM